MNQTCKVCGEPAAGFHFGAFTCEGCKVSSLHKMHLIFTKSNRISGGENKAQNQDKKIEIELFTRFRMK